MDALASVGVNPNLPSMECYSGHLIELEKVISEYLHHGPVVIMGEISTLT